jgi:hypothetical protein
LDLRWRLGMTALETENPNRNFKTKLLEKRNYQQIINDLI